jgi:thiosulfate dehydrogenase (quinone) large subunit
LIIQSSCTPPDTNSALPAAHAGVFGTRWLRGAAVVRILFGVLWAFDASFKWLPGFRGGQTLPDELSRAAKVHTPAIHEWLELWNTVALANPGLFATVMAVLESLAALALIFGVLSNVAFIGTAVLSFGIWSGAEGFHLPFHAGMTDLGPSAGYVFASLALFFAAAGSTWSVDTWLRPRLGRFAWLAAPATN